ncbi:hypothetical protein HMPREF3034_01997 [Prevotella sp. DNF00663]|uniref:calycin-like domain-containing protein n=1 Tax=Prevotella sp. DNF00663 TaxID=1384078 RepID=UPI000781C622|nr:calycin-like domain-containing protein [Prevotella sp. DNF00663]KXB80625.1 hypothetical protein HMPREF3034_01997 [Prevotella sp. DNF00663]
MKRTLLCALAFYISLICSAQIDVSPIFGEYTGKIELDVSPLPKKVNYVISKGASEGTIKLVLKSYEVGGSPYGDITLDKVPVTQSASGFVFGKLEGVPCYTTVTRRGQKLDANLTLSLEGETNGVKGDELTVGLKISQGKDVHTKFVGKKVATSITTIQGGNKKADVYYHINGSRVVNPTKRGVYIINGKKVLKP